MTLGRRRILQSPIAGSSVRIAVAAVLLQGFKCCGWFGGSACLKFDWTPTSYPTEKWHVDSPSPMFLGVFDKDSQDLGPTVAAIFRILGDR